MITCPFCQFSNEDGSLFCEQCKSDLAGAEGRAATPELAAVAVAAEAIPVAVAAAPVEVPPLPVEVFPTANVTIEPAPVVAEAVMAFEAVPAAAGGTETITAMATMTGEALMQLAAAPPPEEEATPVVAAVAVAAEPVPEVAAAPPVAEPAPAPAPVPPPASPGAAAVGTQPRLVVIRGLKIGQEYPLYEGHNFVGRMDDKPVDIDLEDQEAPDRVLCSRQHALITFEEGQLMIEDLNSSNGTFVNRNRIYPGQRKPLAVGDVLQLGSVQMRVKV